MESAIAEAEVRPKRTELIKLCTAKFPDIKGNAWFNCSVEDMALALETGELPESLKASGIISKPVSIEQGSSNAAMANQIADMLVTLAANGKGAVDKDQVEAIASATFAKLYGDTLPTRYEVIQPTGEAKITGDVHFLFKEVLMHVTAGDWCYLYGPAGSGKTTLAENVADSLERPFATQSCFGAISGTVFNGYMDAHGNYVSTNFRRIYETGGVFILDEVDAAPSEILLVLNAALSNCYHAFPDGMIKRHPDFICIACANTVGNGATIEYNGRNALDRAFLDRFSRLDFPYDEAFELRLAMAQWPENPDAAKQWAKRVQAIRKAAARTNARICVSPRASIAGVKLLKAGLSQDKVEQRRIFAEVTPEIKAKILAHMEAY